MGEKGKKREVEGVDISTSGRILRIAPNQDCLEMLQNEGNPTKSGLCVI